MKLTIIRGMPGSGKSTYAKKNYSCLILEQDMFHMKDGQYKWSGSNMKNAISWCLKSAEIALRFGMDVCVCNVFSKAEHVEVYADLAARYGANLEVVRMCHEYGNVHDVPAQTLVNMKKNFEDWPGEKLVGTPEPAVDEFGARVDGSSNAKPQKLMPSISRMLDEKFWH